MAYSHSGIYLVEGLWRKGLLSLREEPADDIPWINHRQRRTCHWVLTFSGYGYFRLTDDQLFLKSYSLLLSRSLIWLWVPLHGYSFGQRNLCYTTLLDALPFLGLQQRVICLILYLDLKCLLDPY